MKWEYHALVGNITVEKMNQFGREGWELVTVYPEGEENYPAAYFKRPLDAAPEKS